MDHDRLIFLINAHRRVGSAIRLHPNGFLQLNLTGDWREEGYRLHVWPEEAFCARQDGFGIHNHVFDIESTVLMGALENTIYALQSNAIGDYEIYTCAEDPTKNLLTPTNGRRYNASVRSRETVKAGQLYYVPKSAFHTSKAATQPTVTVMKRLRCVTRRPSVLGPANAPEELRAFNRLDIDQEKAWKAIDAAVAGIRAL